MRPTSCCKAGRATPPCCIWPCAASAGASHRRSWKKSCPSAACGSTRRRRSFRTWTCCLERPVYTAQDIAGLLTDNKGFRLLVPQTEQQLGKKLRTADLQILAGLYDDLGMPADVIYLLVCHCVERARSQWGEGRRPTMRQVEKEGYRWAQLGIFDQNSAAVYLKKWAERNRKYTSYLSNLRILNRPPVEAERRYIDQWMDMGFPPETVALAYERTVFYKKDLNWRYLNGILRRWHDAGWHTPHQVEEGEAAGKRPAAAGKSAAPAGDKDAWMRRYIKR